MNNWSCIPSFPAVHLHGNYLKYLCTCVFVFVAVWGALKLGTKLKTSWNLQRLHKPHIKIVSTSLHRFLHSHTVRQSLTVRKEHKPYDWVNTQGITEWLVSNHWSSCHVFLYKDKHGRQPAACTVYMHCNLHCKKWAKGPKKEEKVNRTQSQSIFYALFC